MLSHPAGRCRTAICVRIPVRTHIINTGLSVDKSQNNKVGTGLLKSILRCILTLEWRSHS